MHTSQTYKQEQVEISLPYKGKLSKAVNPVCKYLKRQLPTGIYEEYFRKKFQVPATHHDPRLYSIMEILLAMNSGQTLQSTEGEYEARMCDSSSSLPQMAGNDRVMHDNGFNVEIVNTTHSQLSRLNYPTYFIDEQTLKMLTDSSISNNIALEEIPFPLPSMVMSLPRGAVEVEGQELCNISISKTFEWRYNTTGAYELIEGVNRILQKSQKPWSELKETAYTETRQNEATGEICPCLTIAGVLDGGECVTIKYPITGESISKIIEKHSDNFHADDATMLRISDENGIDDEKLKVEGSQVEGVAILGIKLLCFMSARKHDYELSDTKLSDARHRRGKLMKEAVWGANFIGRAYGKTATAQQEDLERDGRTQRYHWRKRHIRGQWYGKNRSKYKVLIIEPFPVNTPEGK